MPLNVQSSIDVDGQVTGMTVHPANIRILSRGVEVGMIQSFSPNESKAATPIMALGVEGVVTTALGNYQGGTFNAPLIQIYDNMPLEAFGIVDNGGGIGGLRALPRVKSLSQQREPVDVRSITYTPTAGQEIIETYRNCYLTAYSKTIAITSATVVVNTSWRYEKVV